MIFLHFDFDFISYSSYSPIEINKPTSTRKVLAFSFSFSFSPFLFFFLLLHLHVYFFFIHIKLYVYTLNFTFFHYFISYLAHLMCSKVDSLTSIYDNYNWLWRKKKHFDQKTNRNRELRHADNGRSCSFDLWKRNHWSHTLALLHDRVLYITNYLSSYCTYHRTTK